MFNWCFGWEDLNFAKILPLVREKIIMPMLNQFLVSDFLMYVLQITFAELCFQTQTYDPK